MYLICGNKIIASCVDLEGVAKARKQLEMRGKVVDKIESFYLGYAVFRRQQREKRGTDWRDWQPWETVLWLDSWTTWVVPCVLDSRKPILAVYVLAILNIHERPSILSTWIPQWQVGVTVTAR